MNIENKIIELIERVAKLEVGMGAIEKIGWAILVAFGLNVASRLAPYIFSKVKKIK